MENKKELLDEIRTLRRSITKLEGISALYFNRAGDNTIDKNVLFELELLRDGIQAVFINLYMGDLYKDYRHGNITQEEYHNYMKFHVSRYNEYQTDDRDKLYFDFGYVRSENNTNSQY